MPKGIQHYYICRRYMLFFWKPVSVFTNYGAAQKYCDVLNTKLNRAA